MASTSQPIVNMIPLPPQSSAPDLGPNLLTRFSALNPPRSAPSEQPPSPPNPSSGTPLQQQPSLPNPSFVTPSQPQSESSRSGSGASPPHTTFETDPDGFHPSAHAGDDGDSDDDEDDGDDADRAEWLHQGLVNGAEARTVYAPTLPPQVQAQWKKMYPLIRAWWTMKGKDLNPVTMSQVKQTDQAIRKFCIDKAQTKFDSNNSWHTTQLEEKTYMYRSQTGNQSMTDAQGKEQYLWELAAPDYQQYRFPFDILGIYIRNLSLRVEEYDTMKEPTVGDDAAKKRYEDEQKKMKEKLLATFAFFKEELAKYRIRPEDAVSKPALRTFESFVNASVDSRNVFQAASNALTRPTRDQETIWTVSTRGIHEIVKATIHNDPQGAHVAEVQQYMDILSERNNQLQQSNQNNNVQPDTNNLPISILVALVESWKANDTERKNDLLRELHATLEQQPLGLKLAHSFTEEGQLMVEELLGRMRKDPIRLEGAQPGSSTAGASNTSQSSGTSSMPGSDATSSSSEPLFVPEESSEWAFESFDEEDTSQMFDYSTGMTEFGPLEATRPGQMQNPRTARFIVNIGTPEFPVYRLIKGGDLCPGGAEALFKDDQKHTVFEMRTRKMELKSGSKWIVNYGPVAKMERSANYKPKPGAKTRRVETVIKVQYNNGDVEWLTRSEYNPLVGKARGELHLTEGEGKHERKALHLNKCISRGLDPKSGRKLTNAERQALSWLFSTSENADGQ